jgi:hypothetical protein
MMNMPRVQKSMGTVCGGVEVMAKSTATVAAAAAAAAERYAATPDGEVK